MTLIFKRNLDMMKMYHHTKCWPRYGEDVPPYQTLTLIWRRCTTIPKSFYVDCFKFLWSSIYLSDFGIIMYLLFHHYNLLSILLPRACLYVPFCFKFESEGCGHVIRINHYLTYVNCLDQLKSLVVYFQKDLQERGIT